MRKNLYVTDLDFTLLRSDKTLSDFTRRAIDMFNYQSVPFTIATARSVYSLENLVGEIKFPLPIIEFNGGYVTNYNNKEPLQIADIPSDVSDTIIELSSEFNFLPLISTFDTTQEVFPPVISNNAFDHYIEQRKSMKDPRLRTPRNYDEIRTKKILTFTFMGQNLQLQRLYHNIRSNPIYNDIIVHYYENKYTPGTYWMTVHHRNSTKEHAIQYLRSNFNLKDHNLIVFGDDVNDIGMLELADKAIAVQNAKDKVKEVADEIIGLNDQDAVARYILENEGLEI